MNAAAARRTSLYCSLRARKGWWPEFTLLRNVVLQLFDLLVDSFHFEMDSI